MNGTVRVCRNAIKGIIPGGYNAIKVHIVLAVPVLYQDTLDLDVVAIAHPHTHNRRPPDWCCSWVVLCLS